MLLELQASKGKDINGDGIADVQDLQDILEHLGEGCDGTESTGGSGTPVCDPHVEHC